MRHYYNEFDRRAAAWLRELISAGLIPAGDVDERSIEDVQPDDLTGYTQCHFFAGVGGWAIAARLAGWPEDREIWSASCPCQPFSVAGKGAGTADARHLWPDFFRLARARRPAFIVGEQVAAAVGKDWFVGVRSDLEGIGYVGRGIVIPACAVNAPHRRDRLWFAAGSSVLGDADDAGPQGHPGHEPCSPGWPEPGGSVAEAGRSSPDIRPLANPAGGQHEPSGTWADQRAVAGCDGKGHAIGDVADTNSSGRGAGIDHAPAGHWHPIAAASGAGTWDGACWLIGHDGKARRVEPSIPLLVDGLPARAPLLRGYGNAIVPQVASEVMAAWLDEFPEYTPHKEPV